MHQNVWKNGVVIVSKNAQSDTCSLPGKSPTFYITNQFCRVRLIECLLYHSKYVQLNKEIAKFLELISQKNSGFYNFYQQLPLKTFEDKKKKD
jgi:hypothetical protein